MSLEEIWFYFDDFEFGSIECNINISLSEFLSLVRNEIKEKKKDDLHKFNYVYLKGQKLDISKHIKDYMDDLMFNSLLLTDDIHHENNVNNILINLNDYEIEEELEDPYELLFKAIEINSSKPFCICHIDNENYNRCYCYEKGSIYRDIHMFSYISTLNIPGLSKVKGFRFPLNNDESEENNNDLDGFIFVTELLKNCSVSEETSLYLKSKGKKNEIMNPTIRSKIIYGVASTLKQLHEQNLVYSNLALDLLKLDDNFEVKLSNLTTIKNAGFEFNERLAYIKEHTFYKAPEISRGDFTYEPPIDVFAFGSLLHQMFTNKITFHGNYKLSNNQITERILNYERADKPQNIPDHYWDLIKRCWEDNPYYRPTFQEITHILKDDKYALEEFGMKTDLDELHEYQKRIETINKSKKSNVSDKSKKKTKSHHHHPKTSPQPVSPVKNEKKIENGNFFINEEDLEFYDVISKIGEGATSVTYKVLDTKNNKIICKKILKYNSNEKNAFKSSQNSLKEFEVLHKINHPCICKAYLIDIAEKIEDPNIDIKHRKDDITTISLYLEYLDYSLKEFLMKDVMSNTLKTRIVIEIIHAMNFIHKNGMIHRDLKIDNIMLNSVFEAKLIDFGFVRIHECLSENYSFVADSLTKGVETFAYMSPEMLNEQNYDYKTDVYSFGIVLYSIFLGNVPKQNLKDKMVGKMIDLPEPSMLISKCCIDLIKMCLANDPSERPSFDEIIKFVRDNSLALAPYIDEEIISKRDNELKLYEK